jgi:hypothetical protein
LSIATVTSCISNPSSKEENDCRRAGFAQTPYEECAGWRGVFAHSAPESG